MAVQCAETYARWPRDIRKISQQRHANHRLSALGWASGMVRVDNGSVWTVVASNIHAHDLNSGRGTIADALR